MYCGFVTHHIVSSWFSFQMFALPEIQIIHFFACLKIYLNKWKSVLEMMFKSLTEWLLLLEWSVVQKKKEKKNDDKKKFISPIQLETGCDPCVPASRKMQNWLKCGDRSRMGFTCVTWIHWKAFCRSSHLLCLCVSCKRRVRSFVT